MDRNEMKENMRRQLEDDNYLTFIARNSFMQLWGWLGRSKICGAGRQEKHDGILMPN